MHFLHCGLFDFFYFFAYAVVLIWSLLTILLSLLSVSLSLWILKTLCSHKAGPTKTRCCQGLPALPGLPSILLNISNQDWQLMHLRHKNKGNESMETSSYPDGVFCALADQTQLIQDLFVEWQTLLLGFKCDGNNCYIISCWSPIRLLCVTTNQTDSSPLRNSGYDWKAFLALTHTVRTVKNPSRRGYHSSKPRQQHRDRGGGQKVRFVWR